MGIDFETLIILAVLAFILFGPEKLPQFAAKLGYYMGKLKEASADLSKEYHSSFNNALQTPPALGGPAREPSPPPALAAPGRGFMNTPVPCAPNWCPIIPPFAPSAAIASNRRRRRRRRPLNPWPPEASAPPVFPRLLFLFPAISNLIWNDLSF